MNYGELQDSVLVKLEEELATPVFHLRADVRQSLNDGYRRLAEITRFSEEEIDFDLVKDQLTYDVTEYDDRIIGFNRVYHNTTKRWLRVETVNYMDSTYPLWTSTKSASPEVMVPRSLFAFQLFPHGSKSVSNELTAKVVTIPVELSNSTDVPAFPKEFHLGLVEFALYDLYLQERELAKAMRHLPLFTDFSVRLRDWVARRDRRDVIESMGGG